MSYCSRACTNKGKFYALMQKAISISKTDEDKIKLLSDVDKTIKVKGTTENISQCPLVIRKSINGLEAIVEGCAPAKPDAAGCAAERRWLAGRRGGAGAVSLPGPRAASGHGQVHAEGSDRHHRRHQQDSVSWKARAEGRRNPQCQEAVHGWDEFV